MVRHAGRTDGRDAERVAGILTGPPKVLDGLDIIGRRLGAGPLDARGPSCPTVVVLGKHRLAAAVVQLEHCVGVRVQFKGRDLVRLTCLGLERDPVGGIGRRTKVVALWFASHLDQRRRGRLVVRLVDIRIADGD